MTKAKDFFGKDITEVIELACKFYETTQGQLDIEVLETGSAGIFGLCRKKAHIRVSLKKAATEEEPQPVKKDAGKSKKRTPASQTASKPTVPVGANKDVKETVDQVEPPQKPSEEKKNVPEAVAKSNEPKKQGVQSEDTVEKEPQQEVIPVEPPSQEALDGISATIKEVLALMTFPAEVVVKSENSTVYCNISSEHETDIIGSEGRTLDSLQYLLRKMLLQSLPDKYMLSLDVGNFRERRAEELKERALQLAVQVKEDGKTQAIPALNPSERRIVHMVLQEDKSIRSRSVGDGLFKKVLIYKPGKGRRPSGSKKKKG